MARAPQLWLLLAAGFSLRIWAIGYARFTGDESLFWSVARRIATLHHFPVYGPEITGTAAHHPGALFYYLMAIPQLFGPSPKWGATLVVAGHLFAAVLFYRLLRDLKGERAAFFGLALAMLTPWDILYGDRIWVSCVVPVFGAVGLYAAVQARESAVWQGVLLAVCLLLPQVHLSAPVLWIACGTILLLRPPRRWSKRALLIGLGVTVLLYLPMLVAELSSGFENTRLILSKAGGEEPWSKVLRTPLSALGYAVLYGTAELSYHFDRGYWGGYDDFARYATLAGWSRWYAREGFWSAVMIVTSIALSLGMWVGHLSATVSRTAAAVKRRSRAALPAEYVLSLGLLAGLAAGAALMMAARKIYFPHYANILMPMLLLPLALGLDAAWRTKLRWPVAAVALVSGAAMVINTVRYYGEIDGLNGVDPTIGMVGAALDEPGPVDVRFDHFQNTFAWSAVARYFYERPLRLERSALVRLQVHNGRRHRGPVPEDATLFGPVLMERVKKARRKPPGLIFRAFDHWQEIEVQAGDRTCRAPAKGACRYGEAPWQAMRPDALLMGGRTAPVLFLHPITGVAVVARIGIPKHAVRGTLLFGLSDQAHASSKVPVKVTLRQGDRVLAAGTTGGRGLQRTRFTLTSSGARTLELELTTENDGARVFGFDIDLFGR